MLKWIKKHPFLSLLITFISFSSVIIIGFFVYIIPNYVEFGPIIAFYKAKNCAKPEEPNWSSGKCLFYARSIGIYKNNPPVLSQSIKNTISEVSNRFEELNFNPVDPSNWSCSSDGTVIDLNIKVQDKKTYKCWPK